LAHYVDTVEETETFVNGYEGICEFRSDEQEQEEKEQEQEHEEQTQEQEQKEQE